MVHGRVSTTGSTPVAGQQPLCGMGPGNRGGERPADAGGDDRVRSSLRSDCESKSVGSRLEHLSEHRHRDHGEGEDRQDEEAEDHQGEHGQ